MAKTAKEELMTAAQAKDSLGVSWQKITDLINEGKLPVFVSELDRRKKLVRRSDLDRLRQPLTAGITPVQKATTSPGRG